VRNRYPGFGAPLSRGTDILTFGSFVRGLIIVPGSGLPPPLWIRKIPTGHLSSPCVGWRKLPYRDHSSSLPCQLRSDYRVCAASLRPGRLYRCFQDGDGILWYISGSIGHICAERRGEVTAAAAMVKRWAFRYRLCHNPYFHSLVNTLYPNIALAAS
jgi:hypothetical protein